MVSLITTTTTTTTTDRIVDTCPETLLMDVCRIAQFQLDFKRIVKAATVVTTTNQAVATQDSKSLTVGNLKVCFCWLFILHPIIVVVVVLKQKTHTGLPRRGRCQDLLV